MNTVKGKILIDESFTKPKRMSLTSIRNITRHASALFLILFAFAPKFRDFNCMLQSPCVVVNNANFSGQLDIILNRKKQERKIRRCELVCRFLQHKEFSDDDDL